MIELKDRLRYLEAVKQCEKPLEEGVRSRGVAVHPEISTTPEIVFVEKENVK
ncbi:MAG: hypothetical protein M1524_01965 [Patescibacteria group bacterium]|nr:hypothetical protein [Patescibacteria group bacterium]